MSREDPPSPPTERYWARLERLVREGRVVIDRAKGSAHPRFPEAIYPLDYGYLEGTSAMDGGGIDLWKGGRGDGSIQGVVCTLDAVKKDAEIKILYECEEAEIALALEFLNKGAMAGLLVRKPGA